MSRSLSPLDEEDGSEYSINPSFTTLVGSPPASGSHTPSTLNEPQDRGKLALAHEIYLEVYREFHEERDREFKENMSSLQDSDSSPDDSDEDSPWLDSLFNGNEEFQEVCIKDEDCNVIKLEDTLQSPDARKSYLELQSNQRFYYYSCTPVSQNMEEEPETWQEGPLFIPHADAPPEKFNIEKYLSIHVDVEDENDGSANDWIKKCKVDKFAWQELRDPDCDIIDLEVARRLHFEHHFSFDDIDRTRLLRLPLRDDSEYGLLWEMSQRETIQWESHRSTELKLPRFQRSFVKPGSIILEQINTLQRKFCPNLNCVRMHCLTHSVSTARSECISAPIEPRKPQITHEGLHLEYAPRGPCGEHCFLNADEEQYRMDFNVWDEDARQELKDLLELIPDAAPCDLAVMMCRRRCIDVYLQRKLIFSDEEILQNSNEASREWHPLPNELPRDLVDFTTERKITERVKPCNHKGACGPNEPDCHCHQEKQWCQRNCRCPETCPYRFKGCKCTTRGQSIQACGANCECRKLKRECDPELCISCNARENINSPVHCKNSPTQLNEQQPVEIKSSEHGQGAFALNSIEPTRFIMEYTGEIQHGVTAEHYDQINRFQNLNYTYGFEGAGILNSATLGNEARFINDARGSGRESNCMAEFFLVNNDRRCCLFATSRIKKGEEILLDYGESFWGHDE
ncbi:hypothetical protein GYMLUDRAFT_642697 [Collybiopsis luxurians FD-317 M1]|nr:hypothetical protein GYMLUDRAFT_642697 [Collybiopsis luxurians FD-317 M1]